MSRKSIIIAPDSFKGTLSAQEICSIVSEVIYEYIPDCQVVGIPTSDGGEGMTDCYLQQLGGERVKIEVTGPDGEPVESEYGILSNQMVVMEMASCAGLPLMKGNLDPMHATTYGVGEILAEVEKKGLRDIFIGIGGSATNDVGIGMAAALGYRFLDEDFKELEPLTCNIGKIEHIQKPEHVWNLNIVVACDVDAPLCGPTGATYTFGKQKGVSEDMKESLDQDIAHFASVIKRDIGADILNVPGAGAAGGLGGALIAFLNAELKPGIEMFLDTIEFNEMLEKADLVFTGEGRIDWQSLAGKVPVGVARRAVKAGVPCIALCGSIGMNAEKVYEEGMSAIFSSIRSFSDGQLEKEEYAENMRFLTDSVMRVLMLNERRDKHERSTFACEGA